MLLVEVCLLMVTVPVTLSPGNAGQCRPGPRTLSQQCRHSDRPGTPRLPGRVRLAAQSEPSQCQCRRTGTVAHRRPGTVTGGAGPGFKFTGAQAPESRVDAGGPWSAAGVTRMSHRDGRWRPARGPAARPPQGLPPAAAQTPAVQDRFVLL